MQYSIVNWQDHEPNSLRLDAEYYQPVFLLTEKQIKNKEWDYLENLSESIKSFGAYSLCNQVEYIEKGIPFLRCKDIKSGNIDFSDVFYVSHDANKLLWKSEVKPKMVLFTMSGTVGNSAIATEELEYPINSNQDIAKIVTNEQLNPYFFSVFLQSSYGEKQVSRLPVGSVQQHIFLWQLEKLIVPIFNAKFQNYIEYVFKLSLSTQKKSGDLYIEAQALILSELGLSGWKPKHQLSFVRNYSDADKAGRIDAEYFQPKYDEIVKAIKSYPGGYSFVGKEFKQNKSVLKLDAAQTYQYVEIGSINVATGEITASEVIGVELPANAKRVLKKNDVIVSKVRTYRGAMALVEQDGLIGSGAFTVLRENGRINKETLLTYLRSKPLLIWSLKPNTGTSYPVILDDDILNLPIPLFSEEIQNRVKTKITESFDLRKQSKHLLECAKRAVEIAIEQNEEASMKWLETETGSIG